MELWQLGLFFIVGLAVLSLLLIPLKSITCSGNNRSSVPVFADHVSDVKRSLT